MAEHDSKGLIPRQPYIQINTKDYEYIVVQKTGISQFYEFTDITKNRPINAVPDGCVDLVFAIGENGVKSYIGGTVLKLKYWPLEDSHTYFGVRFQPGECVLPHELKIEDIINTDLELNCNSYGKSLGEQLAEAHNLYERSNIFMQYYLLNIRNLQVSDGVKGIESYVRNKIYETKGEIPIKEIAAQTGYSECYVRRAFHEVHGISPKTFEKIVRFQNLLEIMSIEEAEALREIAMEGGYFDQSHMMKEFKSFMGMTPEKYQNIFAKKK